MFLRPCFHWALVVDHVVRSLRRRWIMHVMMVLESLCFARATRFFRERRPPKHETTIIYKCGGRYFDRSALGASSKYHLVALLSMSA